MDNFVEMNGNSKKTSHNKVIKAKEKIFMKNKRLRKILA